MPVIERRFPLLAVHQLRMMTDGAGVTTLVAAAGCPLRCQLCLNPQSWNGTAQPRMVLPEELYARVRIDDLYFRATGGGVTFGGGEPLLHAAFIAEFQRLCGAKWRLCAETCLNVPETCVRRAAECVDEFIVDVKDVNSETYRAYTGADNAGMLENLRWLLRSVGSDRVLLRVPEIPDWNGPEDVERSIAALRKMGAKRFGRFRYVRPKRR